MTTHPFQNVCDAAHPDLADMDCERSFILSKKAWYSGAVGGNRYNDIIIDVVWPESGISAEFSLKFDQDGVDLQVAHDAWFALPFVTDLLVWLANSKPAPSYNLAEVALQNMGFEDATVYQCPYDSRQAMMPEKDIVVVSVDGGYLEDYHYIFNRRTRQVLSRDFKSYEKAKKLRNEIAKL